MARTTTSSDAQIRDRYRRALRRSPQAQAIAQDLEDGDGIDPIALGRWNRGEDPALRSMSRANAAVAARGFSAAAADRGRAMQSVNEALQAQPDSSLPPAGKAMFERMQSRLPGNAKEFLRDADEYSGRRAGNYNIGGRKPSATPAEPEPEATGTISTTRNSYLDELAGTAGTKTYNAADMARKYQEQQFDRANLLDKIRETGRNRGAELQANQLAAQLRERGITTEPRTNDGSMDVDKARGLLTASTFQEWQDDRDFDRTAKELERETKRELAYWRRAQDGGLGIAAQRDSFEPDNVARIQELQNNLASGESNRGSINRPSFWRLAAEGNYNVAVREQRVAENADKISKLQNKSAKELSGLFGASVPFLEELLRDGISPEEAEMLESMQL